MKKIIFIIVALLILSGITAGIGYYFIMYPNTIVTDDGIIYIRNGATIDSVQNTLQQKGYLKSDVTFRKIVEIKKYPSLIKPGRYKIRNGMNNNNLVNMLRSGNQAAVKFTFNNIRTIEDFADMVATQLNISRQEFLDIATDPAYISIMGFTKENFIGMFIPNTYEIYWNISATDFITKMAGEYRKYWNTERRNKAEKAGLSPMDVTILASIIEEETIKPEEYPVIAGVYINRLNQDIPLEACPTLKFALGDFTLRRILHKHMEVESPYNTYKHRGLPPGPVRMPSITVMDAVLNYQKHEYLFFCAKSDFSGAHNFSKTLRQHNEYARQYHEELNKRHIY